MPYREAILAVLFLMLAATSASAQAQSLSAGCSWSSFNGRVGNFSGNCSKEDFEHAKQIERRERPLSPADLDELNTKLDRLIQLLEKQSAR